MVFKSFSIERRLMKQYQEHSENITSEELKRGRIEGATGSFSSFWETLRFFWRWSWLVILWQKDHLRSVR